MRYARKVDSNQQEIVRALRAVGAQVMVLSDAGNGRPDLFAYYRRRWFAIEVKNLDGKGDKLSPAETREHSKYCGAISIVRSISEALKIIGATKA